MDLKTQLNELLVETFNTILKAEELALKQKSELDLSISELHLIEAIEKTGGGRTIGAIAGELSITLPSVTVAINKLVKKGYVEKVRSKEDGREVLATLTEKGVSINDYHRSFHTHMVSVVTGNLDKSEQETLFKAISRLNKFFKKTLVNK